MPPRLSPFLKTKIKINIVKAFNLMKKYLILQN